jgi:integrating conjugative element protein (TIGR03761 family)
MTPTLVNHYCPFALYYKVIPVDRVEKFVLYFSYYAGHSLLIGQASIVWMGVLFCIVCRSAVSLAIYLRTPLLRLRFESLCYCGNSIVLEGPMTQDSGTELRLAEIWQEPDAESDEMLTDDITNSDTEKVVTIKPDRPGRIVTKGQIRLHTRTAFDLFYGRKSDREAGVVQIVGLVLFASLTNQLITLCRADDPYAEAVLIKVEKRLRELENRVDELKGEFEAVLQQVDGMEIECHESISPTLVPISFANPYGFIAARCLVKFDRVFLHAYSAKHAGLILQKAWHESIIRTRASFRNLFQLAKQYRFAGVTRDDLASNNAKARQAIARYGELSESILQGTQRSQFARN